MTIDDLIRVLEKATEEVGDLAPVVMEDPFRCAYDIGDVHVNVEHGTVTLVALNSGHFD